MIYDQEDKVIQEGCESLLSRYQAGIEESIKISDFVFDCVNLLHYKYHKLILIMKRDGSYKDSPDWIKNKKKQQQILNTMIMHAFNTLQQSQ